MRELTNWLSVGGDPGSFPYSAVVAEFRRTGKHFVDKELLALLDQIRAVGSAPPAGLADGTGEYPPTRLLRDFLDIALDKWDGCYDYRSYLALNLFRMPGAEHVDDVPTLGAATDPTAARRDRDRLFLALVADALAFEAAAGAGVTDLLPLQRPEPALVAKRYRLGIRVAAPALARLGLSDTVGDREPVDMATALHTVAIDDRRAQLLELTMLPVYLVHDEYLFIRVLQAYECTFALLAGELRATVAALDADLVTPAAERLGYARDQLNLAAPLFSLLATMQPESFRTFRDYTEGASAIQSRSYKLMESLCRPPEGPRLDSAAYRSVPELRDRLLTGQPSVEQAYRAAIRRGRLNGPQQHLLDHRMTEFASAVLQWRQTHYRLAVRMLGTRSGTGYTQGTPYLAEVRSIPVFTTRPSHPMEAAPRE